jgi:acyl-CoA synthetase (AMP-forming)/AMP-acid ligase II
MGRQLSSRPKEGRCPSFCRQRLAAYKCPRVYQVRVELPKNSLGKVLKDELTLS